MYFTMVKFVDKVDDGQGQTAVFLRSKYGETCTFWRCDDICGAPCVNSEEKLSMERENRLADVHMGNDRPSDS